MCNLNKGPNLGFRSVYNNHRNDSIKANMQTGSLVRMICRSSYPCRILHVRTSYLLAKGSLFRSVLYRHPLQLLYTSEWLLRWVKIIGSYIMLIEI